jgi:hypothetical protein
VRRVPRREEDAEQREGDAPFLGARVLLGVACGSQTVRHRVLLLDNLPLAHVRSDDGWIAHNFVLPFAVNLDHSVSRVNLWVLEAHS